MRPVHSPLVGFKIFRENGISRKKYETLPFESIFETDISHTHSDCTNTDGSYTCVCHIGYETIGRGRQVSVNNHKRYYALKF